MGRKFEFKRNELELDISGKKFTVDVTSPILHKRITEFAEKASSFDTATNSPEALEEIMEFMSQSIDAVLGKDATLLIFDGRVVKFFDLLDVMQFIVEEIRVYRETKNKQYSFTRVGK